MKIRAGKILLAAGAVMLLLSGCRRTDSAVTVLKEAVENCNKAESFAGNIGMDMSIGIKESGMSIGMDLNIDMDIEAVRETGAYHMKGGLTAGLMDLMENIEVYGVPDEKGSDFLTYVNMNGSWAKTKNPSDEKENVGRLMNLENYFASGSELEMKESGRENGREVYVITTTADNGKLQTAGIILDSLLGDDNISIDFKNAQSEVTFKIYKEDRFPASVSMKLSGKDGHTFTISEEGVGEFILKQIEFTLAFEEFDTIETIEVPDKALDARSDSFDIMGNLENEEPDTAQEPELQQDKDGNYILTDWDHDIEVSIPKPDDMIVDQYSDDTYLCFYKEGDKPYSATYTLDVLYEASDEQLYIEAKTGMKDTYMATAGYSDVQYQDEKEFKAGKRQVKYVSLSFTYEDNIYVNSVWAWTIIDNKYMLLCEFNEYPDVKGDNAVNEDVIRALFEGI